VDAEAHSKYLQGLYYGSKWGPNVVAAVAHFKNSMQRDPAFAPAYAELAINYLDLRDSGGPPLKELLPLSKAAAAKALELDPSLPQAHLALGLLAQGDYNWSESEVQYRAALTLNPNCAECHHQYGVFLEGMGRNEEAVVQVKQAIELDPLSSENRNQLAMISFTARQFDLAISQFESLHESAWWALLALSYAKMGRFDEAIATAKKCEIHWGSDFCLVVQSRIYGVRGMTRDARKAIERLKEISHYRCVYPTFFAWAYLATGDKEQALTWMERAYNEKDPALFWLKVWPSNDPLRSEPRFRLF
jgi:adenylate cyclase